MVDVEGNFNFHPGNRGSFRENYPYSSPTLRALRGTGRILKRSLKWLGPVPIAAAVQRARQSVSQAPPPPPPPYRKNMFRRRSGRRRIRRGRRSYGRTRRSSRMSINTFQRDASRQYSRTSAPRSVRRRTRRFISRVNNVISNAQPLQIYTTRTVANGAAAADTQSYVGYMVGTQTHLLDMFTQAYNETASTDIAYNRRLIVKNMCIDYQVTNTGSYPIILDVYHCICRASTKTNVTPATLFSNGISALSAPAGLATGTALAATDPELTLFENPLFCKHFKIKSKKEVLIATGNTVTFQLRKSKNREFEMQRVNAAFGYYPGYSEGLFFMWRGTPRNTGGGATAELSACSITIATQVTGHYGIPPTTLLREAGMRE